MPKVMVCMRKQSSVPHPSNAKPVCQVVSFASEHQDGTFAGIYSDADPGLTVNKRPSWTNARGVTFSAQLSWVQGKQRSAEGKWTGNYQRNINDQSARGLCGSDVDTTELKGELPDMSAPSRYLMSDHGTCENYFQGSPCMLLTKHHTCNPHLWAAKRPQPDLGREEVNDVELACDTEEGGEIGNLPTHCLLYTSPSPRDRQKSRMPSSA